MYQHNNGLTLRKVTRGDLDHLLRIRSDGWHGFHRTLLLNADDQERWYEGLGRDDVVLVAEREGNPLPTWTRDALIPGEQLRVGVFNARLDRDNRSVAVSWGVFEEYRGKGYGTKLVQAGVDFCFEMHDAYRLECEILATNVPSSKVAEKAGFRREGTRVEAVHRLDERLNSDIYGLLRPDWRRRGSVPRNKVKILNDRGPCDRAEDAGVGR